ncbi:MFS general substrate transporter [Teratosphaeria destructans]|uniref:MFS general substrate transporter n=1 Tax=Teratosphaeria destructans TaxID=418781 RepID=A0A9W7SYC9_9PEZI|nr:MFS general substrate transporter [Teratosphaeria destructans]
MEETIAQEKRHEQYIETLGPVLTHIDNPEVQALTQEHRDYLIQCHGTLEMDPIPDMSDADPYNWPQSRKVLNLVLVAFHAMMATFTAAAIQSAFEVIAADLNVSLTRASYLTSLQIAILGAAPLFWRPLSNRYGRRPIFIISLICSLVGNIGCANSPTYATMALCRAIVAFFISPAAAIGSAVVAESFFKNERARYMGVWTLMVTIGVPISPFIFGFVTLRVGYRWIYYTLAITNGIQLIVYTLLGPETRYLRQGVKHAGSSFKQEYLTFKRIDPTPLTWFDFVQPLTFAKYACVFIPAFSYAMVFLFGSIMITVEVPQLFGEKFHFNAQELGLQFLGPVIGSIIGEQIGGFSSDRWMQWRKNKTGRSPNNEFRLWLAYLGELVTIAGAVVFLVQLQKAPDLKWNVTPVVGTAIAAAGSQIVTTVMVTYAVDCYREEAASVGVFITFVRQTWGFIGPFWFPAMFEKGLYVSAALAQMEARRPPEYTIDLSADRSSVKDVVKGLQQYPHRNLDSYSRSIGVLHTIFFHRYFTPLHPATHDVLDITLPYVSDETIERLIESKSNALLRSLDTPAAQISPSSTPKPGRSTLVVQFSEKRRRKSTWFGVQKGEEEMVWENWIIDITMTSARSEPEAARNRRVMESQLQKATMEVIEIVNREKEHIPPITTSEVNPFPFQILVNPKGEGWGQRIGIF